MRLHLRRLGVALAFAGAAAGASGSGLAAQANGEFVLASDTPVAAAPPFVGNGRITLVASARGIDPALSFMAGLYEHAPGDVPRLAALPDWSSVDVIVGGRPLSMAAVEPASLAGYRQALDLRDAVLTTRYAWLDGGRRTDVAVEAFVSRAVPDLGVVRIEIIPRQSGPVVLSFPLRSRSEPARLPLARLERLPADANNARLWYPGWTPVVSSSGDAARALATVQAVPTGSTTTVALAAAVACPGIAGARTRAGRNGAGAAVTIAFDGVAGRSYICEKYVGIAGAPGLRDSLQPAVSARATALSARARGWKAVRGAHAAAARALWQTDIVVEGDPELQRAIRAMLFYLRASAGHDGWSLGPMGLSGAGYYGHVFWDADTWMFPPLLLLDPAAARSMVDFRCRVLDAARRNAKTNGFAGAMYPWESDETGAETTPRFAAQNASSEIHVTGDVALAQRQYFLATGDTAWLARCGFPVLAGTADFWTSRATQASDGTWHIRNVVSADEGLVGIDDDAYTNGVAMQTLRAAAAAARRLGRTPDPRWDDVASKLYLPYDSAGGFHRTFANAPQTLGSVVPLLAYPLGVDMPTAVERADLENAVRRLRAEGEGAMMTSTLYPVIAAELGDRALVDSLLTRTWRPWVQGAFLLLSETPAGLGATAFLTGAGGFLQQVLYGWTGLRITEDGVAPAFRPVLPSSVRRLLLRGVHTRSGVRDVVVEGDSLRMLEPGLAESEIPAQAPRAAEKDVDPVLSFPEPGMDDSAAYQGYRTRFWKDAAGDAVQVYLDARSGRVVTLWADAANESLAFTARDSAGRPAAVDWAAPRADVPAAAGGARALSYYLKVPPATDLGLFLLGSMRFEREFGPWQHPASLDTTPYVPRELPQLIAALGRLEPSERRRQLLLLRARDTAELRARLTPTITRLGESGREIVRVEQPSLDGRTRLRLDLEVDGGAGELTVAGNTVQVRSPAPGPVNLIVTVTTTAEALHPLTRQEIFRPEFLAFLERARAASDSAATAHAPASDPRIARYRWLEREVRGVELVSYREKLMAGLPNFATYFGRDDMLTALLMRPIWTPAMQEAVVGAVLRKLAPSGEVSHEEALGGQAIRENAVVYDSLVDAWALWRKRGRRAQAEEALARARDVVADLQAVHENYRMVDDEFQLPVVAGSWIESQDLSDAQKRAFLQAPAGGGVGAARDSRLVRLLRELAFVARRTRPYVEHPVATNLVDFKPNGRGGWVSGSWRDSEAGYGRGRFAMDVNAIWIPAALRSMQSILDGLDKLGWNADSLLAAAPELRGSPLERYARKPALLGRAIEVWDGAGAHFLVSLGLAEVQERVSARIAAFPVEERPVWSAIAQDALARTGAFSFLAISLDAQGHPIGIASTDPMMRLLLGPPPATPAAREADLRDVRVLTLRYPVGLMIDGVGPAVANDAYAPPRVWEAFRTDLYHSPRVVWGRETNVTLAGLARRISGEYAGDCTLRNDAAGPYVRELTSALDRVRAAVEASGLEHHELWSYRVADGRVVPVRYATSSDVQLWNLTDLAVQYEVDRVPRCQTGTGAR